MASTKLMETKDGRRFFQISVSRGYGKTPYRTRWYWPMTADGQPVAKSTAERELRKVTAEFERACAAGEVLLRAEKKEKAAREAAEAARRKTVRQYANENYMPYKEIHIVENTRLQYRYLLDSVVFPELGDKLMTDITPAMITKLILDYQKKGYSRSMVLALHTVLNGVFQMAFLDDSIPFNPVAKVKRPTARADETPKEESELAYTVEELNHILTCVEKEPLKWQAYIWVSVDIGCRRGEVCGIQRTDIDFDEGTITIRRNLQYSPEKGIYEKWPKNKRARVVDIGPETMKLLRELLDIQSSSCFSKWVFTKDGTDGPMHPDSPTRYFKKFGKKYGIAHFHPHKLRHTNASIAITNGADVVSVSQRLGHRDPSTTLKMYSHANEESIRKAGQTVRDALKARNEKS